MDVLTWVRAIPAAACSVLTRSNRSRGLRYAEAAPGGEWAKPPAGVAQNGGWIRWSRPPASSHGAAEPVLETSGGHSQRTKGSATSDPRDECCQSFFLV